MSEEWKEKAKAILEVLCKEWKYICMDSRGVWRAYQSKPVIRKFGSEVTDFEYWFTLEDNYKLYCDVFDIPPAPDWTESLIERGI